MRLRKLFAISAVLVLLLAACGGDSDGDGGGTSADQPGTTQGSGDGGGTSSDQSSTTQGSADGGGTAQVTEMGSFTVNGTVFAVNFLNRCIPFDGVDSEQIDLQPIAQGQGAQLNLYGTADSVEVSVQGSAVAEIGGTNSFDASPFGEEGEITSSSIDGNRWTGAATLADSYGSGSTVEVTWDVMVPDEIRDCSL